MNSSLSDFIRSSTPPGNIPQRAELAVAQQALGSLLRREMHRLGFWHRPPACLGVPWAHSWSNAHAFEELLADCFLFTLLRPFGVLVELSKLRSAAAALVADGVGWFLTDTERIFDPLSYGLRKRLQAMARMLVNDGALHVVAGDPRVDLHSTLAATPGAVPAFPTGEELRIATEAWHEDLMPELITARGARRLKMTQRLQELLLGLFERRIECFRLIDLVATVRDATEERWQRDEALPPPQAAPPLPSLEIPQIFGQRRQFRTFLECVGDSIDHLTADEATHVHLSSLWLFLRSLAHRMGKTTPLAETLGRHLNISAEQIRPACATLRRLMDFCRGDAEHNPREDLALAANPPPSLGLVEHLLKETHRAQETILAAQDPEHSKSPQGLEAGSFFITRAGDRPSSLWLVVAADPTAGHLHVVPADLFPLLGRGDVALEVTGLGPLKLRCGLELKIPGHLDQPRRVLKRLSITALSPAELERIALHRHQLGGGGRRPALSPEEFDRDPALEDWIHQDLTPNRRDLESLLSPTHPPSDKAPHQGPSQTTTSLPLFSVFRNRTAAGALLLLALLLVLALTIFRHCGQQTSGHPQHPTVLISAEDCVTLLRTPQWCGEPEEMVYARANLHPHLIDLPQGGRPAGRTRDRGRLP